MSSQFLKALYKRNLKKSSQIPCKTTQMFLSVYNQIYLFRKTMGPQLTNRIIFNKDP